MKKIIYRLILSIMPIFLFCSTISSDTSHVADKHQTINITSSQTTTSDAYSQAFLRDRYFKTLIPTTSINESFIEETFGASGANLDQKIITRIKQAYCYLEFLYKLDQVKNNNEYQSYNADFADYINEESASVSFLPTTKLVASQGWKNIPVTGESLIASDAWQLFIKSIIANCYHNDSTTVEALRQVKSGIFYYIPNIETSYYTTDFSNLRNLEEILRIKAVLHSNMRNFYLNQCADWKGKSISKLKSDGDIGAYTQGNFYKLTNAQTASEASNIDMSILNENPFKENVWCYYMFKVLIADLYSVLTIDNLNFILKNITATKISPCFTDLNIEDLPVLYDYYLLKENHASKSDTNISTANISSNEDKNISAQSLRKYSYKKSSPRRKPKKLYNPEELRHPHSLPFTSRNHPFSQKTSQKQKHKKIISAQGLDQTDSQNSGNNLLQFTTAAGSSLTSAGGDLWKGLQSAADFAVNLGVSVAETTAGFGIKLAGEIKGNQAEVQQGQALEDAAAATASDAINNIDSAIKALGDSLKDGIIGPIGDLTGAFVTLITTDAKIGQDTAEIISSVADELVNFTEEYAEFYVNRDGFFIISLVQLTEDVTDILVNSVMAISGQDTYVSDLSDSCLQLIKDIAKSVLRMAQVLYDSGKAMFETVMNALKAVTNSLTTIFIDSIREVSFVYSMLSDGQEVKADELRDEVTNTLENNRSAINAVVGTVLAVAIDVAITVPTLGIGTAAAVAGEAAGASALAGATAATAAIEGGVGTAAEIATAVGAAATEAAVEAGMEATEAAALGAEMAAKIGELTVPEIAGYAAATTAEEAGMSVSEIAVEATNAAINAGTNLEMSPGEISEILGSIADEITENPGTTVYDLAAETSEEAAEEVGEGATEGSEAGEDGETTAEESTEEPEEGNEASESKPKTLKEIAQVAKEGLGKFMKFFGMIMNAGFGILSTASGIKADADNSLKKAEQEENLRNLWSFIENSKKQNIESQSAFINELAHKQSTVISNQKNSLIFLENYLNQSVNNNQKSIAKIIASQQINLLTPESNTDNIPADFGYPWGLQTPFISLYPSESFTVATTGREEFPFSQEIAQLPTTIESSTTDDETSSNSSSFNESEFDTDGNTITQKSSTEDHSNERFWFNQRALANANQSATDPLNVEMKFNIIYKLNSAFHLGMFVGGTFHDYKSNEYLNQLKTTESADLDAIHLAKLFVIFRGSADAPWQIGIYEPEGEGWLIKEDLDPTLYNNHHTYHMSASLNGASLTASFWSESLPEKKWSRTINVSKTDQRPYGVIYSGAALEWGMISPAIAPVENSERTSKRGTYKSEKDRNKQSNENREYINTPSFGSIQLKSLPTRQALAQEYIYETTSTDTPIPHGSQVTDQVAFAIYNDGEISKIGLSPLEPTRNDQGKIISNDPAANSVISLISGKVYNKTLTHLTTYNGPWDAYKNTHDSISSSLITRVENARTVILTGLTSVDFGEYKLTAVDVNLILNDTYIYTNDNLVTASSGEGIKDYLVPCLVRKASVDENGYDIPFRVLTVDFAPDSLTETFISLVTRNIFDRSGTIIKEGYYYNMESEIPEELKSSIQASKDAYSSALSAAEKAEQEQKEKEEQEQIASNKISSSNINTPSSENVSNNDDSSSSSKSLSDQYALAGGRGATFSSSGNW